MATTQRPRSQPIHRIVRQLCRLVADLESEFAGRRFTLDGHLVGSIGEVLAADRYELELLPTGAPTHDARAVDGTLVQIKTTQAKAIGLRSEPEHLLVVALDAQGAITEVYNGPGRLAWEAAGNKQQNGQKPIGLSKLRSLMAQVPLSARLRQRSAGR